GAATTVEYRPSTLFYRDDADAGNPWATKLAFPVQCVARVVVTDEVSGSRMVSRYAYHHGYYDTTEREFRGFARVDHTDAESFTGGATPDALTLPPVETRQWFHTGAADLPPTIERD